MATNSNSDDKVYWCGPFYFPKWAKRFLSRHFNEACHLHDMDYDERLLDRKEIDLRFLKNMLETSDKAIMAFTFYIFVRMFGWISYKGKK